MKILRTVLLLSALALALNGCGGTAPASDAPTSASLPELEDTNWLAVSADAAVFDLEDSLSNPNFEFVFNHTDTVPLDQLIAFALAADAASEGAYDELRSRFLEAPNTVLTYLLLLGDQPVEFRDNPPAAEVICQAIASADAALARRGGGIYPDSRRLSGGLARGPGHRTAGPDRGGTRRQSGTKLIRNGMLSGPCSQRQRRAEASARLFTRCCVKPSLICGKRPVFFDKADSKAVFNSVIVPR